MRPIIEDTKIDKTVQENFEAIRDTLCGNISLDNMSLRILEGTTKESDTENLINHSGHSRPVGWLPLVGDVYVQEISSKYVDIRSTKPDVNYKILVLFGNAITQESLKAIGGDTYQTTSEVTNQIITTEITNIEEVNLQFKPNVVKMYTNEPLHKTTTFATGYNSVVTDGDYFYITQSNTTNSIDRLIFRVNRTTGASDYLDLAGTSPLTSLYLGPDGYLYACRLRLDLETSIYKIDLSTFTVTTSYTPALGNTQGCIELYVDTTNIYISAKNGTSTTAYLIKHPIAGGGASSLSIIAGGTAVAAYSIVPVGTDLWVVVDDTSLTGGTIVQVSKTTFTVTTTNTSTDAFQAKAAVYAGGQIIAPVRYLAAHAASGGTVSYISGGVSLDPSTLAFTFQPASSVTNRVLTNCVTADDYVYACDNSAGGDGLQVIRVDALSGDFLSAWIPFYTPGVGSNELNGSICIDIDDTPLFIRNPIAGTTFNFEYAEIDFSDYT